MSELAQRGLAIIMISSELPEVLGMSDRILVMRGGRIVAVSVQTGGFLGVGGREVILMLDQLRREGDQLVTGLSQAQVEAQPPWDG